MKHLSGVLLAASTFAAGCVLPARAQGPMVVFDMDTAVHKPTEVGPEKKPCGDIEVVEGKLGKACRFTFNGGSPAFFTAPLRPTPEWDQAAGISFWVKGDGSASCGGLEMIDRDNYSLRYAYCFPLDSPEWRKIVIPWRDLVPELPAGPPVDPKSGYAPSHFGNLWFGKWWYWRDYPAHSFTIDQLCLERALPSEAPAPAGTGLSRVLARLRAKQPVTLVTLGDSLSDKRHWANRELLWSEVLVTKLKESYGSAVTLVNPAIGGTLLSQNLVLMPRWLKDAPQSDLVTVWLGFNDWESGIRRERWAEMERLAVAHSAPRDASGIRIPVEGVSAGTYLIEWGHTYEGKILKSEGYNPMNSGRAGNLVE